METTAPARSSPLRDVAPAADDTPTPADLRVRRPAWLSAYTGLVVVLDAAAMAAATLTAKISWLGINPESFHIRSFNIPYGALALATVPAWIVLLALAGAYDLGPFATSPRTWMQVVRSGAQLLAVVAVAYYILHLAQLGRGVLVGLIPLAVVLTLAARAGARLVLDQLRRRGHARRSALLVGHQRGVDAVMQQIVAHPAAGVAVVGVSVLGSGRYDPLPAPDRAGGRSFDRPGVVTEVAPGGVGADPTTRPPTPANGGPLAGAAAPVGASEPNGGGSLGAGTRREATNGADRSNADGENGSARSYGEHSDVDRLAPIARSLARHGAETLIITGGLAQGQVRDIAWMLEGTGVALLVTPAPADLRELTATVMRPVAGLPLLHLDT